MRTTKPNLSLVWEGAYCHVSTVRGGVRLQRGEGEMSEEMQWTYIMCVAVPVFAFIALLIWRMEEP